MTESEKIQFNKQVELEREFLEKYSPRYDGIKTFQNNLCRNVYGENAQEEPFQSFTISKERLAALIFDFAQAKITDGELRQEFFAILSNKHPNVVFKYAASSAKSITGRIAPQHINMGFTPDQLGKTATIVCPGEEVGNREFFKTDFEKIAMIIHEIFTAMSQKHCGKDFICPADHRIGEIEGVFGEALFFDFIKDKAADLAENFKIQADIETDKEFFKKEAAKYDRAVDLRLAKNLNKVFSDKHDFNDPKIKRLKHIIAAIFLPHVLDSYHTNQDFAMNQFKHFLKNNSCYSVHEAVAALSDGAFTSLESMFGIYKNEKREQFGETVGLSRKANAEGADKNDSDEEFFDI